MALPKVNFNITNDGLGRLPVSKDAVSGLVIYNDNITDLNPEFTATDNIKPIFSLQQAEDAGISDSGNFTDAHYILSEYFRQGGGKIWVGVFPVPATTYDYTEFDTMKSATNGEVRQYGVYVDKAFDSGDISILNSILEGHWNEKKPAVAIMGFDFSSETLSTIDDVRTLSSEAPRVSVVLGQDTENYPAGLSKSMPNIGAVLGALSASNVATNILYVNQFNYSDGEQMVTPGFYVSESGSPTLKPITHEDFTDSFLGDLNDKGYIFWRYLANVSGSYLNNANNSAEVTSDYAYIHNNRVMGKALRLVDGRLSKYVGAPVKLRNGVIAGSTVTLFNTAIENALNGMVNDNEISEYEYFIDPNQDIAATGELRIQITIVPVFSADKITIEIGYGV